MGLLSSWSTRAKVVLDGARQDDDASAPPEGIHEGEDVAGRMSWGDICSRDEFRGRWVALDDCRYDEETGRAAEGAVVDADEDLVELCSRIRDSERKNCAILFCGDEEPAGQRH